MRPSPIARIEAHVFRQPIEVPVATSFGVMRGRPAVFLRLEDRDGAHGWGEVFANWPAAGAEHRARLVVEDIADLVLGRTVRRADALFAALSAETEVRALQCGEWGPFAQGIAGLDTALWDLFARRAGQPLARYIRADAPLDVPAYASGVHIDSAASAIARCRTRGFTAFKVKVGFDRATDAPRVNALAESLRPGEHLMADANQAWDVSAATEFLRDTAASGLGWLEEPVIATACPETWRALDGATATPLAGGENLAGFDAFETAFAWLSVVQPDVAKWGGVTGCLRVARAASAAGRRYCPHFLGGGIGLAASAHLLAAVGGDGMLEVDANPNALRDAFAVTPSGCRDARWPLHDAPGLGVEALPDAIEPYRTLKLVATERRRP